MGTGSHGGFVGHHPLSNCSPENENIPNRGAGRSLLFLLALTPLMFTGRIVAAVGIFHTTVTVCSA
jgi:hypothetical protein